MAGVIKLVSFVALVSLINLVRVEGEIQCYVCAGTKGDCLDPFNKTAPSSAKLLQWCKDGQQCMKSVVDGDDDKAMFERGCVGGGSNPNEVYCESLLYNGLPARLCYCDTDGCNNAPAIGAVGFLVLMLSVLSML